MIGVCKNCNRSVPHSEKIDWIKFFLFLLASSSNYSLQSSHQTLPNSGRLCTPIQRTRWQVLASKILSLWSWKSALLNNSVIVASDICYVHLAVLRLPIVWWHCINFWITADSSFTISIYIQILSWRKFISCDHNHKYFFMNAMIQSRTIIACLRWTFQSIGIKNRLLDSRLLFLNVQCGFHHIDCFWKLLLEAPIRTSSELWTLSKTIDTSSRFLTERSAIFLRIIWSVENIWMEAILL